MVLDFAGDFLRLGKTPDDRRNLLRSACSAWNVACAPEEARAELLDQFLANHRKLNPGRDAGELQGVLQDMEPVRSVPSAPKSHPFVERLIGTVRREYLDRLFFWNGGLGTEVETIRNVLTIAAVCTSRWEGATPTEKSGGAALGSFRQKAVFRGSSPWGELSGSTTSRTQRLPA